MERAGRERACFTCTVHCAVQAGEHNIVLSLPMSKTNSSGEMETAAVHGEGPKSNTEQNVQSPFPPPLLLPTACEMPGTRSSVLGTIISVALSPPSPFSM